MADKPRPKVRKEEEKITVGQVNGTRALIGCDAFESKVIISSPLVWLARQSYITDPAS